MSMERANPKRYELEAIASAEYRANRPGQLFLDCCACDEEAASHNYDRTWLRNSSLKQDRTGQPSLARKSIEIARAPRTSWSRAPFLWPYGSVDNGNVQTEERETGPHT